MTASYCNRALVHLKMKNYELCIKDCEKTPSLDKKYLKAYHRRGKALVQLLKYEDALCDFEYIMDKEP